LQSSKIQEADGGHFENDHVSIN